MSYTFLGKISYSRDQLLNVSPCNFRGKPSCLGDIIEKFSAFCKLKHNQRSFFLSSMLKLELGLGSMIDNPYNIRMINLSKKFNLYLIGSFFGNT
jgi:hypothetical protein